MKKKRGYLLVFYVVLGLSLCIQDGYASGGKESRDSTYKRTDNDEIRGLEPLAGSFTHHFSEGWNFVSFPVLPETKSIHLIFKDLIDNGILIKIQDSSGRSFEQNPLNHGWMNQIGELSQQKAYRIQVKKACRLPLKGDGTGAMNIRLKRGWNLVPFPFYNARPAEDVLYNLILNGTLILVKDDTGKSMHLNTNNEWVNQIGPFKPGKAYNIKVLRSTTLQF